MKRQLMIIALHLTLGVIINVGVAWWFVISTARSAAPRVWYKDVQSLPKWPSPPPQDWPEPEQRLDWPLTGFREIMAFRTQPRQTTNELGRRMGEHSMVVRQYGWPLLSMESRWISRPGAGAWFVDPGSASPFTFDRGIAIPSQWFGVTTRTFVHLPVRPIWSNFAANTALCSLPIWLTFYCPFALRRWRRRRRGCCVKCGYDLRGCGAQSERCPECGAAIGA